MAARVRQNNFNRDLAHGRYNLDTDQLRLELVNAAADPAADVLANITPIAYTFAGSRNLVRTSSGVVNTNEYALVLADLDIASTGGATGPFRTIYVVNATKAGTPIMWHYDLGAGNEVTIADGATQTFDFDQVNGALTLQPAP